MITSRCVCFVLQSWAFSSRFYKSQVPQPKLDSIWQEYQSYLSRIRSFLASTRSKSTLLECERLLVEARKCATAMQAMAAVEGNIFRIESSQNLARRDLAPLQEEIRRGLLGGGGDIEEVNREDLFYRPPVEGQNLSTQMLINTSDDLLRETRA